MSHLIIQVIFVAHSYSGVRIMPDRREVLDWPPSPARLHEALLSAALVGLPRPAEEQEHLAIDPPRDGGLGKDGQSLGTTPSCCIWPSVSYEAWISTTFPFLTRNVSMPCTANWRRASAIW